MSPPVPHKSTAAMSERAAGAPRWAWLLVLVVGAALYLMVERALISTGNVNFVPSLLLLGLLFHEFRAAAQASHVGEPYSGVRLPAGR